MAHVVWIQAISELIVSINKDVSQCSRSTNNAPANDAPQPMLLMKSLDTGRAKVGLAHHSSHDDLPGWVQVVHFLCTGVEVITKHYTRVGSLPHVDGEEPPDLVSLRDHITIHQAAEILVSWGIAPQLRQLEIWHLIDDNMSKKWLAAREVGSTLKLHREMLVYAMHQQSGSGKASEEILETLCYNSTQCLLGLIRVPTFEMFMLAKLLPDCIAGSIAVELRVKHHDQRVQLSNYDTNAGSANNNDSATNNDGPESLARAKHIDMPRSKQCETGTVNDDIQQGCKSSIAVSNDPDTNKPSWMVNIPVHLLLSSLLRVMRYQQVISSGCNLQSNKSLAKNFKAVVGMYLSQVLGRQGGVLALLGEMLGNVPEGNIRAYTHVVNLICTPPKDTAASGHHSRVASQVVSIQKSLLMTNRDSEASVPHKHRLRRATSMLINRLSELMVQREFQDCIVKPLFPDLACWDTISAPEALVHGANDTNVVNGPALKTQVEVLLAIVSDSPPNNNIFGLIETCLQCVFILYSLSKITNGQWRPTCQQLLLRCLETMPRKTAIASLINFASIVCKASIQLPDVQTSRNDKIQVLASDTTEQSSDVVEWKVTDTFNIMVSRKNGDWDTLQFQYIPRMQQQLNELETDELLELLPNHATKKSRDFVSEIMLPMAMGRVKGKLAEEDNVLPENDKCFDEVSYNDPFQDAAQTLVSLWSNNKHEGALAELFCTLLDSISEFVEVDDVLEATPISLQKLQNNISFMVLLWSTCDMSQVVQDTSSMNALLITIGKLIGSCAVRLNLTRNLFDRSQEDELASSTKLLISLELAPTLLSIAAALIEHVNEDIRNQAASGNHVSSHTEHQQQFTKLLVPLLGISSHEMCDATNVQLVGKAIGVTNVEGVRHTLSQVAQIGTALRMSILSNGESPSFVPSPTSDSEETVKSDDVFDPFGDTLRSLKRGLSESEPPMRAMAVDALRDFLLGKPQRSNEFDVHGGITFGLEHVGNHLSETQVERVVDVLVKQLYDPDPYVFLTTIRALGDATDKYTEAVLPKLLMVFTSGNHEFLDPKHTPVRLRVGEVLMLAVRRAGEVLPKYIPTLVPSLTLGASVRERGENLSRSRESYDPITGVRIERADAIQTSHEVNPAEFMLRSSCLAILAYVCPVAPLATFQVAHDIVDLAKGVLNLEVSQLSGDSSVGNQTEFVVDTRRAASYMLEQLVLGWDQLGVTSGDSAISTAPELVKEVYRLLKVHGDAVREVDEIVVGHCTAALGHLDAVMRRYMFPERKLELKVDLGLDRL